MKVSNTRRIAEKIAQIMQIKQASSMVNMLIANNIAANSIIPPDVEALRREAAIIQKEMPEYSVDRVMMLLMVESLIGPYFEKQPEVMEFFMNWIAAESMVFDAKEFNKNPYIQNIDFTNQSDGDYELRYHDLMPYELDIYNIPRRIEELCVDIPRVACFPVEFKYPVIFQKSIKATWMSVSPNEVFTMEKPIKNAKGKVLTLGCGMGYFSYMASLKEDVESITIVELEQSIIDLFEKYLLPQFENKDKITIIKADAIEFLRDMADGTFDYCFADIWIGIEDIAPYFAIKEIGRKLKKTKIDYWIEESFAILLSSSVWIEILKSFSATNNIELPPVDYPLSEDDIRKEKYIHKLFEEVDITKPEHIDYYLNSKNIIGMIDETNIIY